MSRPTTISLALLLLAGAILGGCGAVPLAVARSAPVPAGGLTGVEPIVWVGTDFRGAVFADPYMLPARVIDERVPLWNQQIAAKAVAAGVTKQGEVLLPIVPDLTASEELNKAGKADQVSAALPTAAQQSVLQAQVAQPLDAEAATGLVKPFVGGKGLGILLVVHGALKDVGCGGAWIVFDRTTGKVHFTGRALARASGMGVFNYYGNGFYRLAEAAVQDVMTVTGRRPQ